MLSDRSLRLSAEVYGDAPRGIMAERELWHILKETEPEVAGETDVPPLGLLRFAGPRSVGALTSPWPSPCSMDRVMRTEAGAMCDQCGANLSNPDRYEGLHLVFGDFCDAVCREDWESNQEEPVRNN